MKLQLQNSGFKYKYILYEGGPYHNWPRDRITRARRYVIHRADVGKKFRDLRKLQLPQPGVRVSDPFTEGKGFASRSQHSENMSWLRFAKPTHAVIHGNDGVNLYIFIPPLCGWHSFSASRKAHLGTIEGNFTHVTGRTHSLTHSPTDRLGIFYLTYKSI